MKEEWTSGMTTEQIHNELCRYPRVYQDTRGRDYTDNLRFQERGCQYSPPSPYGSGDPEAPWARIGKPVYGTTIGTVSGWIMWRISSLCTEITGHDAVEKLAKGDELSSFDCILDEGTVKNIGEFAELEFYSVRRGGPSHFKYGRETAVFKTPRGTLIFSQGGICRGMEEDKVYPAKMKLLSDWD